MEKGRGGSLTAQPAEPGKELAEAQEVLGLDKWPTSNCTLGKLRPMEGRSLAGSYGECSGRAGTGTAPGLHTFLICMFGTESFRQPSPLPD